MKFDDCVAAIPTQHDLKRTASAHVVDYTRLNADELKESIIKTAKQYTHPEAVASALEAAIWQDANLDHRVLSEIIICDIIINESGFFLPLEELEEKISQIEQGILNESNEKKLRDLAGGKEGKKFEDLSLYNFVLETAWQHCESKSVDETNLLRKLRDRLGISNREARLLEAMMGKYPKLHNELHCRTETLDAVRSLQSLGLLMIIRDDKGASPFVAIPEEVACQIRQVLGLEMRRYGYQQMLMAKYVRKKPYLQDVLKKCNIAFANESVAELQEKIVESVKPSVFLGGLSPRDGLNSEEMYQWCQDLHLPVGGTKNEKISRLIEFYDQLKETSHSSEADPREVWYNFYFELAHRDIQSLRSQQIIDKDIEIERAFEAATSYLFEVKLNHPPLKQAGTEHCDGLLSFRDSYIMWDNKSKETPVNLADHIGQFSRYINKSEKPVPVFLVIAPSFTPESESVALSYMAENIGRNIALVTAIDLKNLAELWSSESNKRNSEPFPLGLLARTGMFQLDSIKASIVNK